MNHGEGWIFVTAVISASKRNNFSSDFRGVSRKFVSSANRILNFSTIFCKGSFLWAWTHKGILGSTEVTKHGQGPWWLCGPPRDVTICILMALGAFKLMCELNIFNFKDEEPSAIQKYQNAEPQLLGLDDKKMMPWSFLLSKAVGFYSWQWQNSSSTRSPDSLGVFGRGSGLAPWACTRSYSWQQKGMVYIPKKNRILE